MASVPGTRGTIQVRDRGECQPPRSYRTFRSGLSSAGRSDCESPATLPLAPEFTVVVVLPGVSA